MDIFTSNSTIYSQNKFHFLFFSKTIFCVHILKYCTSVTIYAFLYVHELKYMQLYFKAHLCILLILRHVWRHLIPCHDNVPIQAINKYCNTMYVSSFFNYQCIDIAFKKQRIFFYFQTFKTGRGRIDAQQTQIKI